MTEMWVVIQRGKYYSEMDGDIFAMLCRQYADDGRPAPVKAGEAGTYQEARDLAKKLQKERHEENKHANADEVGGCKGGGDTEPHVEKADTTSAPSQGDGQEVPGGGSGAEAEPACGDSATGEAGAPVEGSILDAQQQGLLPVAWAQDDTLAGVRGEEDRLPVFTGERFCRQHPREARIMVNLRFVYGFKIREVAKILGCSPQTVSNVCQREVTSQTAKDFRMAMAARLRFMSSELLDQVQERVGSETAMNQTSLKDVVTAMEKVGNMLQQMETETTAGQAKDAHDPEHTKEMEKMAQDYLERLERVTPV